MSYDGVPDIFEGKEMDQDARVMAVMTRSNVHNQPVVPSCHPHSKDRAWVDSDRRPLVFLDREFLHIIPTDDRAPRIIDTTRPAQELLDELTKFILEKPYPDYVDLCDLPLSPELDPDQQPKFEPYWPDFSNPSVTIFDALFKTAPKSARDEPDLQFAYTPADGVSWSLSKGQAFAGAFDDLFAAIGVPTAAARFGSYSPSSSAFTPLPAYTGSPSSIPDEAEGGAGGTEVLCATPLPMHSPPAVQSAALDVDSDTVPQASASSHQVDIQEAPPPGSLPLSPQPDLAEQPQREGNFWPGSFQQPLFAFGGLSARLPNSVEVDPNFHFRSQLAYGYDYAGTRSFWSGQASGSAPNDIFGGYSMPALPATDVARFGWFTPTSSAFAPMPASASVHPGAFHPTSIQPPAAGSTSAPVRPTPARRARSAAASKNGPQSIPKYREITFLLPDVAGPSTAPVGSTQLQMETSGDKFSSLMNKSFISKQWNLEEEQERKRKRAAKQPTQNAARK